MILCLRSVEVTAEGPPVGGAPPPVEISEEPFFEVSRHDSMRHLSKCRHGIQDPPRKLSVKERMARLISYTFVSSEHVKTAAAQLWDVSFCSIFFRIR